MVGIAIGMLIVIAAIGSLLYTRASSTTVGDGARLYQDASTAFRVIGETVRQGGARRLTPIGGNVEFNSQFNGFGSSTQSFVVSGVDGATTPTIAGDTLRIAYDSDGDLTGGITITDCLGSIASSASNNVSNTFDLSAGNLRCTGNAAAATAQPLIQGVEDFQVWYGLRNPGETFRYRPAGGVSDWTQVETVMVCLRLSGETRSNPTAASVGCSGEAVPADGRIRRVFTRVFNIRNAGV
jgi:type IV pilus assembly protein PilW